MWISKKNSLYLTRYGLVLDKNKLYIYTHIKKNLRNTLRACRVLGLNKYFFKI